MEARKVDEDFSIQPLEEGDEGLVYYEPSNVPLNHTDLQANIMIYERSSFEKQKPWGKGGGGGGQRRNAEFNRQL